MKFSIIIERLIKKYHNFKLNDISLKVSSGKMHAIIGASGSGKTVTIKSLIGGINYDGGKIYINGQDAKKPLAKQTIGYVPEFTKFPRNITTYRFLKSLAKMNGLKNNQIKQRLQSLMEEFNIWEFRNKNMNAFSSGMKKKVMVIQGIIHNPDILILDEPEANLDTTTRKQILGYLRILVNQGKTVFFSTHLLNEVKDVIDECSIIYRGNLLYSGPISGFQLTNSFVIECEDNEAMVIFFKDNDIDYLFREESNDLFFKLKNSLEINKIFIYAIEYNLIIYRIEPYTIDLDFFYNTLISEKFNL
ncbi:ABC transporter ATP-binding protein [Spiroplasma endosymbiont of 'Nebria riversi']|uniref:ABC transporter ATP-binding protein n=1 Tax=Spiroplasma endosymbiont of 'Nebria riversi' TaxID=2792084 RepID=UPI001C04AFF0|nr:ABC transporter ATP-binding protein [Spiroplasma endosymbiont of 'Nebria riversi']